MVMRSRERDGRRRRAYAAVWHLGNRVRVSRAAGVKSLEASGRVEGAPIGRVPDSDSRHFVIAEFASRMVS